MSRTRIEDARAKAGQPVLTVGIDASRALVARRTGTERYSFEIIRHLLAMEDAAAVQWRLYTPVPVPPGYFALNGTDPLAAHNVHNVHNAEVCVLPQTRLWTHRRLAREVVQHAPNVLFVPAHVLPWLPPGRHLPPSVVTVHDLGYHFWPQAHTRSQYWYLDWSTRHAVRHATRLLAVSNATAQDLQNIYHAPSERVRVVHEASTAIPARSAAQIADTLQRLGIAQPYALFVGTLQPRKNLERLIEACARVRATTGAGFSLVLAGAPGWLSAPIQEAAQRLNDSTGSASGAVHLTGAVSDDDLHSLLRGAQFFCFPSLFEGFGLPILEAQSAGVPVMTANNSSLPEIAGDAALLVDPNDVDAIADAMLRLSRDEALRAQLIAAGHENVKRFSWAKAARETLAVLREAAAPGEK